MTTNPVESIVGHTPGSWRWELIVGDRRNPLWVLSDDLRNVVLTTKDLEFGPTSDPVANRNLIAAAPEMYEALRWFCQRVDAGEVRAVRTYARFKALIAKAEGRP